MILGIAIVGGLGFYLYVQHSATTLTSGVVKNDLAASSNDFVQRLTQLQSIKFDDSLFADPRFRSLVDFSEPINPQPVGRSNPFVLSQ